MGISFNNAARIMVVVYRDGRWSSGEFSDVSTFTILLPVWFMVDALVVLYLFSGDDQVVASVYNHLSQFVEKLPALNAWSNLTRFIPQIETVDHMELEHILGNIF